MTPSPPRSLAELTVWAASHPGGAADEINRLRDALEFFLDEAVSRWHETAPKVDSQPLHDWLGMTWEEYGAYTERGIRGLLASFSDRPDERNQT